MNSPSAFRIIAILAVLACAGLGFALWQGNQNHRKALAAADDAHRRALDDLQSAHNAAFATEQEKHMAALKKMTQEHEKTIDSMRQDQRKQMTTALKEFDDIFDGNRRTIDYLNVLEGRIRAGQNVSKAEVEKLAIIATGLGFLQKEYQKPFSEFKQLEEYFAKQAANLPQRDAESPQRFGFFKRVFSKEAREAQKQQLRDEGAREAFEAAQIKFNTVYAAAQRQMSSVSIDADQYVKKIYDLIDEKNQANTEDLGQFFDEAREALRTHQEVLDFVPTEVPQDNRPRP
jgi:hypothetical protein